MEKGLFELGHRDGGMRHAIATAVRSPFLLHEYTQARRRGSTNTAVCPMGTPPHLSAAPISSLTSSSSATVHNPSSSLSNPQLKTPPLPPSPPPSPLNRSQPPPSTPPPSHSTSHPFRSPALPLYTNKQPANRAPAVYQTAHPISRSQPTSEVRLSKYLCPSDQPQVPSRPHHQPNTPRPSPRTRSLRTNNTLSANSTPLQHQTPNPLPHPHPPAQRSPDPNDRTKNLELLVRS